MSASRRFPISRFQPGIAAMYAWTGAFPSAFAICGLPPERRTLPFFRVFAGPAFAPALVVPDFRAVAFFMMSSVLSPQSSVQLHGHLNHRVAESGAAEHRP